MNFTGHFINHTAVKLSWLQVPQSFRFGTILGYKLRYAEKSLQNLTLSEVAIPNRLDNVSFHTTIANLKIYTPYSFWIAAFTYKSTGVYSDEVTIWTDEFSKYCELCKCDIHSCHLKFQKIWKLIL